MSMGMQQIQDASITLPRNIRRTFTSQLPLWEVLTKFSRTNNADAKERFNVAKQKRSRNACHHLHKLSTTIGTFWGNRQMFTCLRFTVLVDILTDYFNGDSF